MKQKRESFKQFIKMRNCKGLGLIQTYFICFLIILKNIPTPSTNNHCKIITLIYVFVGKKCKIIFLEAKLLQWIIIIAIVSEWVIDWETWRVNTGNYLGDLVLLLYERLLLPTPTLTLYFIISFWYHFESIFDFCETLA